MRVCVDARTIYRGVRRGTGKNLIDLYRGLARERPTWQFTMLHRGQGVDDPFADLPNVTSRAIDMPGDRWDLWERLRLPWAVRCERADILHCPANTAPRWIPRPTRLVVTVHDLVPLDFSPPREGREWARRVGAGARRAARVITPSEYSRQRIVDALGVSADKVVVNPWAPDGSLQRVSDRADLARVRAEYGLEPDVPYVLGFGAADPRKNTERVLLAWAGLDAALRERSCLLLVGIQGAALLRLRERARELGLGGSCVLAGFAPEADVPVLLSGAAMLCYPSLAEGFGLPIVDAFRCRTPVLTSNRTSLPEVAADAAVLVDPESVEEIRDGLARLLTDDELRADLVRRGAERCVRYTWDACVRTVANVFESVHEH